MTLKQPEGSEHSRIVSRETIRNKKLFFKELNLHPDVENTKTKLQQTKRTSH